MSRNSTRQSVSEFLRNHYVEPTPLPVIDTAIVAAHAIMRREAGWSAWSAYAAAGEWV